MKSTPRLALRLENLPIDIEAAAAPDAPLRELVAKRLGMAAGDLGPVTVVRRTLDARRHQVCYRFVVDCEAPQKQGERLVARGGARLRPQAQVTRHVLDQKPQGARPVVVGAGPAGLFAALTLAQAGWPPLILERGKPVERRGRDVAKLYSRGELREDSNVCYGEGGAGTYSDGKLYTRIGDARITEVLKALVVAGAPAHILTEGRPHIGTDKLVKLLQAMRARLVALGATFAFDTALAELGVTGGRVQHVVLRDGTRIETEHVVLATGHSAREVWEHLDALKLPLECRPFAVGMRIEHPQALINEARYGSQIAARNVLPAADYRLTHNEQVADARAPLHTSPSETASMARSAFSFCMCPGGVVVTTPTSPDALCINGMSHAARQGPFANSAMVVSCGPQDFAAAGFEGTFAGVQFQEAIERRAFAQGGGAFVAPAVRVSDFVAHRVSTSLPRTSYRRGIVPGDIDRLFAAPLLETLRHALGSFERKLRGFISEEAVLIGVETRTASPIRLVRRSDGQVDGACGLYPAGEGMGFGGGIVSAAVDGVRAAEALLHNNGARAVQLDA